jgi:sigma-B regulation protein RsbU (phosphoserine phosphatase)
MPITSESFLHKELIERREKLQAALPASTEPAHLVSLLSEVDAALERMEGGSYGLCEECHEPIEAERLMADPLVRLCLDHLTRAQRLALEEDLELAARIQAQLLPKADARFDGWEMSYHYQPAGPVSGDYCDVLNGQGQQSGLLFLLGDVSGKGVAASMLMAHLHAMFHSLAGLGLPVDQLMERANRLFCESTLANHYATLVCGRADHSGNVQVCNAGHCPLLIIQDGQVASVGSTGLPLGLFCSGRYVVESVRLRPGHTLLAYTDGLTEARNGLGAEYGGERLSGLAGGHRGGSLRSLLGACLADHAAFRGGVPVADDLTIMALRRNAG